MWWSPYNSSQRASRHHCFWERGQKAFDVKVFNPFTHTHCSVSLPQCYRCAKLEKKRKYEERISEVEHGVFSPLVFSCTGGMGPLATVVYKRIATLLSEKSGQSYSKTLYWLRCKLSFSLLWAAITCLRGSRSSLWSQRICNYLPSVCRE